MESDYNSSLDSSESKGVDIFSIGLPYFDINEGLPEEYTPWQINSPDQVSIYHITKTIFDDKWNKVQQAPGYYIGLKGTRLWAFEEERIGPFKEIGEVKLVEYFKDKKGVHRIAFEATNTDDKKLIVLSQKPFGPECEPSYFYNKTLDQVVEENKYDGEPIPYPVLVDL